MTLPWGVPCPALPQFPLPGRIQLCLGPDSARCTAPTASPVRWQQVTMLMSPPCTYSSSFLGCPCGRRPDVGSPRRPEGGLGRVSPLPGCGTVSPCPAELSPSLSSPTLQKVRVPMDLLRSPRVPTCPAAPRPPSPPRASVCPSPTGCHPWVPDPAQGFVRVPDSTLSTPCPQGCGVGEDSPGGFAPSC